MTNDNHSDPFEGWCVLEILGHRRCAGFLREQQVAGAAFIRIDIPTGDGMTTQLYSPQSVYAITPTTEEIARAVAAANQPEPVHRWELPTPTDEPRAVYAVDVDDDLDHPF